MQERHGIRVVQYNLLGNYCCKCENYKKIDQNVG